MNFLGLKRQQKLVAIPKKQLVKGLCCSKVCCWSL